MGAIGVKGGNHATRLYPQLLQARGQAIANPVKLGVTYWPELADQIIFVSVPINLCLEKFNQVHANYFS